MAVELHRTRELFPSSSLHGFQLTESENDVVSFVGLDIFEALGSDQSEQASSETESSDCMADSTQNKISKESWDFGVWPCTSGIWSPFGSSYGSAEEGSSREETPPATPAIEKRQVVWGNNGLKLYDTTNAITASMEKLNIANKADDRSSVELPKYPPIIGEARFRQNQAPTSLGHQRRAIQKQERSEESHVELGDKKAERARKWENHPKQKQTVAGPGMRAVFLDGSGSKNGPSSGTGVFLPCVIGDTSRSRKKKGCSPVLIPAKVMQALKDHFERMDNLSRQNNGVNFPIQRDTTCNKNNSQKKRQSRPAQPAVNQNDIGLPQDWTY